MSNIGNKETMAKNLAYYLERSNMTQREMAEVVGVAASTFNDWMKAKKYPRIDKIEIMANYFGISKSDLIEEKENKKPTYDSELSDAKREFIDFVGSLSDEEVRSMLRMMKSFHEEWQRNR